MHRKRMCNPPENGGDNCTGEGVETEICLTEECPGRLNSYLY